MPREKLTFTPTPFVALAQVPDVSPGIVIDTVVQVFAEEIVYVNG
jgi:hypothetical protein